MQPQFDANFFSLSATNPARAPTGHSFAAANRLVENPVPAAGTPLGRFLRRHSDAGDGLLVWCLRRRVGRDSEAQVTLHGGYGQLLADKPPGAFVGNGTAQEEPSCFFIATTLRF